MHEYSSMEYKRKNSCVIRTATCIYLILILLSRVIPLGFSTINHFEEHK